MRFVLTAFLLLVLQCSTAQPKPDLIPYRQGKLWGYSNRNGDLVLQPQWYAAGFFRNGKARVAVKVAGQEYWAIIDKKGGYLLPPERRWNGEWRGFRGTALNMSDSLGNLGMLDTNNRVLLPPSYRDARKPFQWRAAWNTSFLEVSKEGRRGIIDSQGRELIPFLYTMLTYLETTAGDPWQLYSSGRNKRSEVPAYDSSMLAPIIALREGKYGLLSIDARELVPFGTYDNLYFAPPRWIICVKGKQSGVLNAQGRVLIPLQDGQLSAVGQHWFAVQQQTGDGRSHLGLLNEQGDTLLPFRYSRIKADQQYLELAIADSAPPPEIQRKAKKHEILMGEYTRHLGLHDLKPVDSWTYRVSEITFNTGGGWCGTSSAMLAGMQRQRNAQPYVFRNDSALTAFEMDGISWYTIARAGIGLVALRGLSKQERRIAYSAIVDEQTHYVSGPLSGDDKLIYYNRRDGLLLSYKGDSYQARNYTVLDTGRRPLIKDVSGCLALPFRWKGKLYVMAAGPYCGGDIDVDPLHNHGHYKMLLDSNAAEVAFLKPYHLIYISTRDGRMANNFEGYFYALDSFGRPGIIDINGRVQYPAVSFQDLPGKTPDRQNYYSIIAQLNSSDFRQLSYLEPVGNGWYIFNQHWVDSNNRQLLPGITVRSMRPATYTPLYTAGWVPSPVEVNGVYLLEYELEGSRQLCYVTDNGVVHAETID